MAGELDGQVRAWGLAFGCVASMAATTACHLGIPDMLASNQEGLTAQQIAHKLGHDAPRHANELERIMRLLCAHGVFALRDVVDSSSAPPHYTLTPVSRWLCAQAAPAPAPAPAAGSSHDVSLYPFLRLLMSPPMLAAWEFLPARILQGSNVPFEIAHQNMNLWTFARAHPHFNQMFNAAMACSTRISINALLQFYPGFAHDTHTLVDVAGGVGTAVSSIVQHYPHIQGINFDLPHVVATAPTDLQGVQHIGGDMFESIPTCDTIFMKWILHDWEDEDCIKILRNCHKALSGGGKLVIMDALLDYDGSTKHPYNKVRMDFDIAMMVYTGGKERTRSQFESILQAAEFLSWKFFEIPCLECIIEAFPEIHNS